MLRQAVDHRLDSRGVHIVWILGMRFISLVALCKFPFLCGNLFQVFEVPKISSATCRSLPSPYSPHSQSLSKFSSSERTSSNSYPPSPRTPGLVPDLITEQTGSSITVNPRPHPSLVLHFPFFSPLQPHQPQSLPPHLSLQIHRLLDHPIFLH